jgi:hypothetical protein
MYYQIVLRRHLGKALEKEVLRNVAPVRGDIQINECHNAALGRTTAEAWIFSSSPDSPDILPRLLDVRITGMGSTGMNLTGIEQIGDAFYSQSWWCRIE